MTIWPNFRLVPNDPKLAKDKSVQKYLKFIDALVKKELHKKKILTCVCGTYWLTDRETDAAKSTCPRCGIVGALDA